jgi:hypothetical protein
MVCAYAEDVKNKDVAADTMVKICFEYLFMDLFFYDPPSIFFISVATPPATRMTANPTTA